MAERTLATLGAGKLLYQRVAVVTNALSPLGEAFCVQFAREGASLVLVDRDLDGAAALAEDINMLGGLDPNFGDIGNDPWGSSTTAVAVQMDRVAANYADEIVTASVDSFGRAPDVIVDVDCLLDSEFTTALSHSCCASSDGTFSRKGGKPRMATTASNGEGDKLSMVTVTPFADRDIFLPGWLGVLDPSADDLDSLEFDGQCLRLHVLCPEVNARVLTQGRRLQAPIEHTGCCNIEVKCNNLTPLLQRLTCGFTGGASLTLVDWEADSGAVPNDDLSDLVMSVNLERLAPLAEDEPECDTVNDDYECDIKAPPSSPRSPLPETIVSRAILGRPFDACLQKNDCYPEDVWGIGGRELEKSEALRVLDDDCVLSIARSSVNCSVRWLLFGYIVIMVAVPRVLGGLSVGI